MIDFSKIRKLYKKTYDIDNIQHTKDKHLFPKIFSTISSVRFCPDNISEYFKGCDSYCRVSHCDMTYHVVWMGELNVPFTALLRSLKQALIVKRVCCIKKPMDVYIVMSPFKRHIPHSGGQIDCEHVNGGFTSIVDNKVFIIRSEEFSKVIIHELLHHCDFINDNTAVPSSIKRLKEAFNVSNGTLLLPNEAVVEYWATVLHCFFLSLEYSLSFERLLDVEAQHSAMQAGKILRRQGSSVWQEKTNSFAYIVFKAILLQNHSSFSKKKHPSACEIADFLIDKKTSLRTSTDMLAIFSRTRGIGSLRMMYLSDYI